MSCPANVGTFMLESQTQPQGRRHDMKIIDEAGARSLTKAELGQVIRYLRELRQWSQETLAELAHSTPRTILNWGSFDHM